MNSLKFKFDCANNRFWRVESEYSYEMPEEQAFVTQYGGQSFLFDPNQPDHWINFTIYGQNIRVFYKQVKRINGREDIIYYQKDVPKKEIIEFELTEKDIIMRREGK